MAIPCFKEIMVKIPRKSLSHFIHWTFSIDIWRIYLLNGHVEDLIGGGSEIFSNVKE